MFQMITRVPKYYKKFMYSIEMLPILTHKNVLLKVASYLAIAFVLYIPYTHCRKFKIGVDSFDDNIPQHIDIPKYTFSWKTLPNREGCSWLKSCSTCHNHPNQNCLWQNSECTKREDNELPVNASELVCPPNVTDFSPSSGPIEGGTVIAFHGENFGVSSISGNDGEDNQTIIIGDRMCNPMPKNISEVNSVLECRIEKQNSSSTSGLISGPVNVTVEVNYLRDLKFGHYIRGAVQPQMQFQFLRPEVYGIYPNYGPLDGETFVMIYGRSLNISNSLEVRININQNEKHSFVICPTLFRFESYAVCKTPKVAFNSNLHSFPVTVMIDFWNQTLDGDKILRIRHDDRPEQNCLKELFPNEDSSSEFVLKTFCRRINFFLEGNLKLPFGKSFQYLPNPIITKIGNFTTVASGGISIRFEGKHLNSSVYPMMTSYVENEPGVTMYCTPNSSGTILECPLEVSKILRSKSTIHADEPFNEKLHHVLKFDGFTNESISDLNVLPDPVFNNSVKVLAGSDRIIEFAGSHLNPNLPYRIVLTAPNEFKIPCEVINFRIDEEQKHLWCRINLSPEVMNQYTETNLQVNISLGNAEQPLNFRPGFARFADLADTDFKWFWLWFLIPACLGIIAGFLAYLWYRIDRRKFLRAFEVMKWKEDLERMFVRNSSETRDFRSLFAALQDRSMLIDPSLLIVDHHLGSGNFGTVYKAVYESPNMNPEIEEPDLVEVAVKVQNRDSGVFYEFIGEAQVMLEFNHPNVMYLVGVTLHENRKPAIVLPFMNGLDLKSFVTSEELKVQDLLCFGLQIANGMTYLSELNLIHRDLALRNCMIQRGTPPIVRVADFGLTRVTTLAYYQCSRNALPFLWMAPEALKRFRFSIKSDVYSYGITLWELMTRGKTPFEFFTPWSAVELIAHLEGGHRLEMPDGCPDLIYAIMGKCWMHDPDDRPVFAEIYDDLSRAMNGIDDLENVEAHRYENSFFVRYSRNREFIFDYRQPQTRDILNQAEKAILCYKIGAVFNPSQELREENVT